VFIYLTQARTGLSPLAVTAARLSITLALAILSYVFVEAPIRYRRRIVGQTPRLAVPGGVAIVTAAALIVGAAAPPLAATFAPTVSQASVLKEAQRQLAASDTSPVATRTKGGNTKGGATTTTAPHELKRVLVVGDSLALTLGRGIERWGAKNGITVLNDGIIGCPIMNGVTVRGYWGISERPDDPCKTHSQWPKLLQEFKPDLIVAVYGAWDVYDVSLDHGTTWISPGETEFDNRYEARVEDAASRLRATHAPLLWLTPPCFGPRPNSDDDPNGVWWNPARVQVLLGLDHAVGATNGMDVSDVIHNPGCPVNRAERPDGVHYTDSGADATMTFLGPVIKAAAQR
jgi:hypothetical protein